MIDFEVLDLAEVDRLLFVSFEDFFLFGLEEAVFVLLFFFLVPPDRARSLREDPSDADLLEGSLRRVFLLLELPVFFRCFPANA